MFLKKMRRVNASTKPNGKQQGRKDPRRDVYSSTAWKKCSEQHRFQNTLCAECLKKDIHTDCSPGKRKGVTDHIIPINQGGEIWNPKNWQTLCNPCHNSKSAKEK